VTYPFLVVALSVTEVGAMAHEIDRIEPVAQDLDLFGRLSQYFDQMDHNVANGLGWLIFNASGNRARRITQYAVSGYMQTSLPITCQHVPWRDFALNSYMVQVELQSLQDSATELQGHAKDEFDIATRVSRDSLVKMVAADVLILSGVQPKHRHELEMLDQTIERRHNLMAVTVLLTPSQPHDLAIDVTRLAPDDAIWDRMFERLYRRCLVAL
jgi:hypothetical protein